MSALDNIFEKLLNEMSDIEIAIWYTAGATKAYDMENAAVELAALEAVKRERDALLTNDAQSVDEFNAGYQAYEHGMDLDTAEQIYYSILPDGVPQFDSFSIGYAWAKFLKEGKR